jgi:hypothetical protein
MEKKRVEISVRTGNTLDVPSNF